jgi:glycosyltransferase involved in cell wall biosynthesis
LAAQTFAVPGDASTAALLSNWRKGSTFVKITLLSPYHGGSHRAWAEGYQAFSQHQVKIESMPARFWKWRMHGGAVTLARRFAETAPDTDLLLATDMLDLTTFLALTRPSTATLPVALYMHENQLTYPLPSDGRSGPMRRQLGERDQHYAFVNYASMLAADRIFFNSQFHRDSFFNALPRFLHHFPEYNEAQSVPTLLGKSEVLPVGIDLGRLGGSVADAAGVDVDDPPLIVWNQRWEYDKNPAALFDALYLIKEEGIPFRLALCGQQFGRRPEPIEKALSRLAEEIVHAGHADEDTYRRLLWRSQITISTAHHEFFGISVMEAIYCGAFPILPRRLSYPELLPESAHQRCLYEDQAGLVQRIRWALTHAGAAGSLATDLAISAERFDWQSVAPRYDKRMEEMSSSAA